MDAADRKKWTETLAGCVAIVALAVVTAVFAALACGVFEVGGWPA